MKLAVVTAKHFTSLNLKRLSDQMNAKDLSKVAIVKIMKLGYTVGKKITIFAGIKRKLLIGKAG